MKPWKLCIVSLLAAGTLAGAYFTYVAWAFPDVRCEAARHLDAPQMEGDCLLMPYENDGESGTGVVREQARSDSGTLPDLPWHAGRQGFAAFHAQSGQGRLRPLPLPRHRTHGSQIRQIPTTAPPATRHHQSAMHGNAYEYRQPASRTSL